MSMWDKSYCATSCDQKDCERNFRFNPPDEEYYSMTTFDDLDENGNVKSNHESCIWKVKKGG